MNIHEEVDHIPSRQTAVSTTLTSWLGLGVNNVTTVSMPRYRVNVKENIKQDSKGYLYMAGVRECT